MLIIICLVCTVGNLFVILYIVISLQIQRKFRVNRDMQWFLAWRRRKASAAACLQRFARRSVLQVRFKHMLSVRRRDTETIEAGRMLYLKTLFCCYMDTVVIAPLTLPLPLPLCVVFV